MINIYTKATQLEQINTPFLKSHNGTVQLLGFCFINLQM
jgi:hypothetical protein